MTNAVNVEFIVEKLLSFLATATDDHFRTDLVGQITQCAERFAPSNAWYVQTIIRVFELAGDKVKASVAQTLTQLIAEGSEVGEEDEPEDGALSADDELRAEAVENFLDLMVRPKLPEILAQAVAWVLGEYGFLSTSCSMEVIMEKLCNLTTQCSDPLTKAHVITAISKLVAQNGGCPAKVLAFVDRYSRSVSLDVQQRCVEFKALLRDPNTLVEVLPVDASCEDIEIDEDLSFLHQYVQTALNLGAKPYTPPQHDDDEECKGLHYCSPSRRSLPQAQSNGMVAGSFGPGAAAEFTVPVNNGVGATAQVFSSQPIATSQGNQLIGVVGAQTRASRASAGAYTRLVNVPVTGRARQRQRGDVCTLLVTVASPPMTAPVIRPAAAMPLTSRSKSNSCSRSCRRPGSSLSRRGKRRRCSVVSMDPPMLEVGPRS